MWSFVFTCCPLTLKLLGQINRNLTGSIYMIGQFKKIFSKTIGAKLIVVWLEAPMEGSEVSWFGPNWKINMATMENSCFWLAGKKISPLKCDFLWLINIKKKTGGATHAHSLSPLNLLFLVYFSFNFNGVFFCKWVIFKSLQILVFHFKMGS